MSGGRSWPGRRYPRILYDQRALSPSSGPRACLHAECLIIDDERALVTSANFTEAAMDRNVEAGVLAADAGFAARLRAQFDALETPPNQFPVLADELQKLLREDQAVGCRIANCR